MRFFRFLLVAAASTMLAAGCADDPAPLFEPTGTGDVSGFLFFDADANGQFTPIGGDTLLVGVPVVVRERGTTTRLDSTVTDASGAFSFTALPPGTHDVFIVRDPALTGALVFCQNPLRASVYVSEQAFFPVAGRLGCVVRIRAAKDTAQNKTVTVAGIVTAAQGTYRSDNIYLQDPTGGMQVFGLPALGLVLGDSIEVTGTLSNFSGELQIVSPQVAATRKSGVDVPAPDTATTGEIAASVQASGAKSIFVGLLTTVRGVTVGAFTSGGGRNADIDDGSGVIQMRLDGNALTTIGTAAFQAGQCYDVTGIVGYFNGTPQLKPRVPSDIMLGTCP